MGWAWVLGAVETEEARKREEVLRTGEGKVAGWVRIRGKGRGGAAAEISSLGIGFHLVLLLLTDKSAAHHSFTKSETSGTYTDPDIHGEKILCNRLCKWVATVDIQPWNPIKRKRKISVSRTSNSIGGPVGIIDDSWQNNFCILIRSNDNILDQFVVIIKSLEGPSAK